MHFKDFVVEYTPMARPELPIGKGIVSLEMLSWLSGRLDGAVSATEITTGQVMAV